MNMLDAIHALLGLGIVFQKEAAVVPVVAYQHTEAEADGRGCPGRRCQTRRAAPPLRFLVLVDVERELAKGLTQEQAVLGIIQDMNAIKVDADADPLPRKANISNQPKTGRAAGPGGARQTRTISGRLHKVTEPACCSASP